MNILLLGSGGREHALAWKIKQSSRCAALYIAPGNAGTVEVGTNVAISGTDFPAIEAFIREKSIHLVIVGPEEPLVKGVVDVLNNKHKEQPFAAGWLGVIGPSAFGAQLEGSKAFSKHFMQRHDIPTAAYAEFTKENYAAGVEYLKQHTLPIVLKADGLAAGKGVLICTSLAEALQGFEDMIQHAQFGEASAKVVVEQFLDGIELSVFVLTDGKDYTILGAAKDYKRIGVGDTGLNTGGMGAVSPVPFADEAFMQAVEAEIIRPTVQGLASENIDYKGFIFFGLIKVDGKPMVIEYNCRMGDPETEVVMPRLQTDLIDLFEATLQGRINHITTAHDPRFACTVMAVSGGYPGEYAKGLAISGLHPNSGGDTIVFHAGTTHKEGQVVTAGGRVLAVTSFGHSVADCLQKSKQTLSGIAFEGMYFRNDIGYEFI